MFELKSYQELALEAVESFLSECASGKAAADVFEEVCKANGWGKGKYLDPFHGKPCMCLRVPTGGGKTIIAAAAIRKIDDAYCKTGAPVVLWLTPSEAITTQTYKALSDPNHPYRQALNADFKSVKVVKVEDVDHALQLSDFRESCIVIVSTIQTFNIADTSQRNAYGFNENFQSFFSGLPPEKLSRLEKVEEKDLQNPDQTHLTAKNLGQVKYSLANLLNLFEPIIIVDEAHNNRTDKFFTTLGRLNPSVVLELTATPNKKLNNVIYQVSAWELKAENMVKLPVILGEFVNGWEICVDESVKIRKLLEDKTATEPDYIRPIVLIQAQPSGQEPSPEQVKDYLKETCGIHESQIAIATGKIKELAGVDLFAKTCPIRFVITVEALKEGWDCSFAYVLCSLQNIHSAKDVEQLLGRVMRMPYARARQNSELNNSYANVVSETTMTAAALLKDRLVESFGFNRIEANSIVEQKEEEDIQPPLIPSENPPVSTPPKPATKPSTLIINTKQNIGDLIKEKGLTGKITEVPATTTSGKKLILVDPKASAEELRDFIATASAKENQQATKENKEALAGLFAERARKLHTVDQTPFPAVPMLCFMVNGSTRILSSETVMQQTWNPLHYSTELEFKPTDKVVRSKIDATENRILEHDRLRDTLALPLETTSMSDDPDLLVKWVANRVRRTDVLPPVMLRFVETIICNWLMGSLKMPLAKLYNHKVELERAIRRLLEQNYQKAIREKFEQALLDLGTQEEFPDSTFDFKFDPAQYVPRNPYDPSRGGREFKKHFCPVIHDLHAFTSDGKTYSEEYRCAEEIDINPYVKRWIRNVERSDYAFWLPLVDGRFFPDFILELTNGKILVIEYKGENLYSNDDSRNKRQVGQVWEKASNGRCFFLMARKEDQYGRNVAAQIQNKIDMIMEGNA